MGLRALALVAVLVGGCQFAPAPAAIDAPFEVADAPVDQRIDGFAGPWLDVGWSRRKPFRVLASKVDGTTALDAFPIVVAIDDPELAAAARSDGRDIVFTGGDATTLLASELESYEAGKLVAWVKVPSLSATADTPLFVYYGNPDPPAPTLQPEDVWSASYLGVWHLQQDPGPGGTGDIRDATAANLDGTADGSMASTDRTDAKLGRGIDFAGSPAFVDLPSTSFGDTFTISAWVKLQSTANGIKTILSNSAQNANTDGFRLFVNANTTNDRSVNFETGNGGNSNTASTAAGVVTVDTFSQVVVRVDRTAGDVTILVDNVDVTADHTILNDFSVSSDFELARMEGSLHFIGTLDEIEIASVLRPLEWLATAFENQRDPAGFVVFDPEQRL